MHPNLLYFQLLAPVMVLKSKRQNEAANEDMFRSEQSTVSKLKKTINQTPLAPAPTNKAFNEYDWDVIDEYDPLWPNEYDKILKERREKEQEKSRNDRNSRNHDDRKRVRGGGISSSRYNGIESAPAAKSGFGGRPSNVDDDEYEKTPNKSALGNARFGGAAIAPPPSLQDSLNVSNNEIKLPNSVIVPYGASSVAAKIMAKYGFKDGQGLGKQEQGMSVALQVEKTSKRGGRIIHENDFALPNAPDLSPPPPVGGRASNWTPDGKPGLSEAPSISGAGSESNTSTQSSEPSITEIMKAPSKVVLLRVRIAKWFCGDFTPQINKL